MKLVAVQVLLVVEFPVPFKGGLEGGLPVTLQPVPPGVGQFNAVIWLAEQLLPPWPPSAVFAFTLHAFAFPSLRMIMMFFEPG